MNGIFISFNPEKLKLLEDGVSVIQNESPYMHLNVQVESLVFAPTQDLILDGTVSKVSPSHVALLVDGLFNASISAKSELLPGGWLYDDDQHYWYISPNTDSEAVIAEIKPGSVVRFRISRYSIVSTSINLTN